MPGAVTIGTGFGVDARDYKGFAKALSLAAPEIKGLLTLRLRAMGEVVATQARENVSGYSSSVPDSIKVRLSGVTVSVVATAKLAGLLELGNRKSGGTDAFSHPVFGNKAVWVKQSMHPFLGLAVREKSDEVEAAALAALDSAAEAVVSRG